jgi:PAS domain S-box-containing protein
MDSGKGVNVPHILLLEDDKAHRDLALRAFQDDPDTFRVSVAGTVREAREIIGSDPPGLIIADWLLPDGKGIEVLTRRDGIVTVPLVVMTSHGNERLAVEIMKSGAIDYVVKSATAFRELPHTARRALRDWGNILQRQRVEQERRDTEKRLADIIGFLPDAVLAIDDDGRVIAWNKAMEAMTGVPAADMLGKGDYEYSLPLYGERRPILIDLVLKDDEEIRKKYLSVQRDGEKLISESFVPAVFGRKGAHVWTAASPLFDTAGNRVGAIETIRDITDRKQADEKLRESERLYRSLFENLLNGFAYCRMIYEDGAPRDFTYLIVNRAFGDLTGLHDVEGKNISEVIPDVREADPRLFEIYGRVASTGIPERFEIFITSLEMWFSISVYSPQSGYFVTVFDVITERKLSEERLRESEEKYHRLYDSMRDAFASMDMSGRITLFNEPFQKMVGYGKEEIYHLTYNDLTPDKWHSIEADIVKNQVLTRGYSEIYEKEYRRKDGTIIPVELRTFLVKDDAGNPQSMSAIVRDITERKLTEEKLRESEEKFRTVADYTYDWEYWASPEGQFWYVSPSCERITGYKPEAFYRDPGLMEKIVHPDDRGVFLEHAAGLNTSHGKEDYTEFRIITLDGRTVWIGHLCRPITSDGKFLGRRGSNRDITEQKIAEGELRQSEMKYRELVDHLPIGVGIVTFDGHPITMNDAMYRITGTSPDTIQETNALITYVDPEDRTRLFKRLAQERVIRNYEVSMKKPDGTQFYANLDLVRFIFHEEPVALVMMENISEKKKAEEALRQSETRFRALIQNSSDIIRILDHHGRIVYESASAGRILGYPPGYFIGRKPMEYIHPDDLEHVKKDFWEVIERVPPGTHTEFRVRKADGKYLWVDSIGVNLLDVPGVNGIVVTTRPIEERKQAEQAIKEGSELLRLALDGADAAFWDWDLPTGKATFSDRFYTMLGYAPGEFPATYDEWVALIHPDDRRDVLPDLQRQIEEKLPLCEIEYRFLSKDGTWTWILGRGKIVETDILGNPSRLTGVNIDITNHKLMESEIRSLNTVLEQRVKDRTEALSKANEALERENAQRVEAEGRLKAAYDEKVMLIKEIHHRVKNNLQIIISLLNLQSRYIKDETTLAAIRESQNRVRAMSLVHEKLYQAENVSKIQIKDYIRFLGSSLFQFYGAKSRGVCLALDIGDVDATINTAIPLGLIVNELISNSLKYAFPDGRTGEITITIRKEDHSLHIGFRDNGVGIPETLDWKDTKSLGLRLVNTLVDQLNGTIALDRHDGTHFSMVLYEKE